MSKLKLGGLRESGSVAEIAFLIVLAVGIIEIFVGIFSVSIALVADGLYSLAMAVVFLVVWLGLRLSRRAPDGVFHFGYYRFETLGSLVAAFFLVAFGGIVIYESYLLWLAPLSLVNPGLALAVALISAVVAVLVTVWIERASRKYGSTSLKTGVLNSALNAASSIAVSVSIVLSGYLGIIHADAIAGILIALAVFAVAYSIIKESSLVLVDACQCGDIVKAITDAANAVIGVKEVHGIRLRKMGSYVIGDMDVVVAEDTLVKDADLIANQVEEKIKQEFRDVLEFKIRIESDEMHAQRS